MSCVAECPIQPNSSTGPKQVSLPMPRSDMSDELSAGLRAKALRARLYAAAISDQDASHKLREYADELEAEARTLELDEE